jgi:hypothetical protein
MMIWRCDVCAKDLTSDDKVNVSCVAKSAFHTSGDHGRYVEKNGEACSRECAATWLLNEAVRACTDAGLSAEALVSAAGLT